MDFRKSSRSIKAKTCLDPSGRSVLIVTSEAFHAWPRSVHKRQTGCAQARNLPMFGDAVDDGVAVDLKLFQ